MITEAEFNKLMDKNEKLNSFRDYANNLAESRGYVLKFDDRTYNRFLTDRLYRLVNNSNFKEELKKLADNLIKNDFKVTAYGISSKKKSNSATTQYKKPAVSNNNPYMTYEDYKKVVNTHFGLDGRNIHKLYSSYIVNKNGVKADTVKSLFEKNMENKIESFFTSNKIKKSQYMQKGAIQGLIHLILKHVGDKIINDTYFSRPASSNKKSTPAKPGERNPVTGILLATVKAGSGNTPYQETLTCYYCAAMAKYPGKKSWDDFSKKDLESASGKVISKHSLNDIYNRLGEDWFINSFKSAKALKTRGYIKAEYDYEHSSSRITALEKKGVELAKVAAKFDIRADKWNPADIYISNNSGGKAVEKIIKESKSVNALNQDLIDLYSRDQFIPVSLKKIPDRREARVDTKNTSRPRAKDELDNAKYEGVRLIGSKSKILSATGSSHLDFSKNGSMQIFYKDKSGSMTHEIFLRGTSARHGSGGDTALEYFSRGTNLPNKAARNAYYLKIKRQIELFRKNGGNWKNNNDLKGLFVMVQKLASKNKRYTEEHFEEDLRAENKGDKKMHFDYLIRKAAIAFFYTELAKNPKGDQVINDLVIYAASISPWSSVYVKVY